MGESGPPKSGVFACDVEAVEATAQQLGRVFDELENFAGRDDAHAADLASNPIRGALQEFYDESSDQRDKVKETIKGLRDMLQALAQGVRDVDKALTDSLTAPAPNPAATPAVNPAGVV